MDGIHQASEVSFLPNAGISVFFHTIRPLARVLQFSHPQKRDILEGRRWGIKEIHETKIELAFVWLS